jgi:hypothetical protein
MHLVADGHFNLEGKIFLDSQKLLMKNVNEKEK